jgi:sigma-E factor negative regulatory protein RseA
MNEELDSQLSAMFDDELPQAECELLALRLSRDRALQARWGRYAAIGAAVRGGDIKLGGMVAYEVSSALASEPLLADARERPLQQPTGLTLARWWRPMAGAALAASVAALSILWLQQNSLPASAVLVARSTAPSAAPVEAPASYVVPRAVEARAMRMPATELANYVVAHSQFSTPVSRGSLLSALMASESAAVGAPEQAAGAAGDPDHHADDSP